MRRVFAVSLSASFGAVAFLAAAIFIIGAPPAEAVCTMTAGGTVNWTTASNWSGCGGTYPGAIPGDTASVPVSGVTMIVDTIVANGVILQLTSGGINVNIPAGTALQIEPSSTANSTNTININGGQLGVSTGTVSWNGNLNHNTGTLALTGTLENVSGQGTFTVNGGTIQGPGTFKNVAGMVIGFTGTGGGMTINGAFVENFGIINYSSNTSQSLSLNNGAHLKVQSGGQFNITGGDPILTNAVGGPAIDIFSGGAMSKGTSVTTTQIDPGVNNGGSVTVTSGNLNLYGGGTHSGAFSTATGGTIMGFNGTHTLAAGTTAAGAGVYELVGGNFNVNTTAGSPFAPQFFTQSGGTLAGTGNFRVTGTFNWQGGTQMSAGTTELQGTTSVLAGSVQLDFSRIMANSGTFNYGPNGANFLGIDNGAHINNTGIFNLLNDAPITSFTPAVSYIENSSTASFNKTGGATSQISAGFDLLGQSSVVPGAGTTIQLLGGSSTSGKFGGIGATINLSAVGSKLDLAGSLFYKFDATATGLTVTGNGILRLSSSAGLAITGGPISVTNFVQDDSSLLKTSAVGISVPAGGAYTWNGGTIDGLGGGGDLITVNASGSLKIKGTSGAMTLQNFAHIRNNGGAIDFNPVGNLSVNNGSVINNASGTFTFNNNSAFGILSDGINSPTFTNNGTVTKAANPNTQQIAAIFNNNTTFNILGGTLQLAGGGTNAGAIAITNAVDRLEITSGTYNFSAGTAISGNGTLAVMNGATLGNNATPSFNNFEMNGSATLNGGGGLTINSSFDWTGGTLTGAGSLTTSPGVITDATALIGPITMADGFTFINNGTFNYNPTFNFNFNDNGGGGVNFSNNGIGVFDIKGNGTTAVIGGSNAFNNFGLVKKTAGAGGFTFTVQFANIGGTVDQQFGSNSTIAFNGAGSAMTGAGTIQSSNAAGNIDFLNPPGSFSVNGGSFAGPGAINLKSGLLIVNSVQNFPPIFNLQGGQLSANQLINIPSGAAFNWNGGSISGGGGQVTIKSGGTMTIDTAATSLSMGLVPLVIDAGGNVNWNSGSNSLSFQAGASVTDNGTFTVSTNSSLTGTASFSVNGIFQHTVPGTLGVTLPLNVQSGGTIRSSGGGLLDLGSTSGVSHAGTFDAQAGSFIDFSSVGTHQFNAGAGFSAGTGTYKINGATLNLNGVNVTAPNFGIAGGSLTGSGNLDTTTSFTWAGGQMAGTGTTTVATGTASFNTGPLTLNRNLVLSGNTTMNAPSGLTVQTTATITNNATFNAQNGDVLCAACTTASFVNNGSIQKGTPSTTNWSVPITGSGTLNLTLGTFNEQAAANFASATINNANANFSGSPVTIGSVSGTASTFHVSGGSTTVSGTTTLTGIANLQVSGGTLTMNGAAATTGFNMLGGTIAGSGALTMSGGGVWSGGSINGTSPMTINGTGTLNITGANGAMSLGRNLVNNNIVNYTPPNASNVLTLTGSTSITNNSAFNITGGFDLANSGSATFNNTGAGTLNRVSGPPNSIIFGPALTNAGNTNWSVGATNFNGGFSQTAGTTTLNSASIGSPTPFNFTGGVFNAKGTVNGDVVINGATFNPGTSPGAVTISGNYTQTSSGVMNSELNGTAAGTSYDQVNVTGNATLAGTLNVTVGYTPANNDFYDVLTIGGTRTGDFTTKNLPPLPGPGTLTATYIAGTPERLRIQATVPNPDLNISASAPAAVFHGQNVTLTFAIGNSGANPANSVVFNETLTNATLVSITSTGPCTTTPISCSLGTLAGGGSTNVVMVINAANLGSITSSASVTHSVADPTPSDNNTISVITVNPASDFTVLSVTAPATVNAGANLTDTVTVKNLGPDAGSPNVAIAVSGGTIVSATGGGFTCTGSPTNQTCSGASLAPNATAALSVVITAQSSPGNVVLTATTSSAADPNGTNNSGTATTSIGNIADLSIVKTGPPTATVGSNITYTLAVTNLGPSNATNVVVNDPTPPRLTAVSVSGAGCSALPCTISTLTNGQTVNISATFTVNPGPPASFFNTAGVSTDTLDPNNSNDFSSAGTAIGCGGQGPAPISPAANSVVGGNATFTWGAVAGAIDYTVNVNVNGTPLVLGPTTGTSISSPLPDGAGFWNVSANFGGSCTAVPSVNVPFTVCSGTAAPLLRLVSEAVSGQTYRVEWDPIGGATSYQLDQSTDINFATVTTTTLTGTGVNFQHTVFTPTAFYYRVRAFLPCAGQFGLYSASARVVITPVPEPDDPNPNVNVPAGSNQPVVQIVHVPGLPGGSFPFVATTDQPWFTVTPTAGTISPGGLDFTVTFNPSEVPGFNGTFTGTIILTVTTSSGSGGIVTHAETKVKAPVSISLVTPVSSTPKSGAPPANALIIPSVGHLNGINSVWRSDIRLANTGFQKVKYQLTFTPSGEDVSKPVKSTTIEVDAGGTTALDDIVRNWYGVGSLGEAANGVLEVRPLNTANKGGAAQPNVDVSFVTVVSSRTYNVSAQGTLGQFIPAVPFASFIGKAAGNALPTILGLQQIAQNADFRTNLGLVEGAGKPATVLVNVFNGSGNKVHTQTVNLLAGEQKQLNGFLSQNGITLADGRIEVQITGGDGKVTAYASRIDNASGDPLLVTGVPLGAQSATHYVLPGVAMLNTGFANWQSDVRMFNAGSNPVTTTVTYYPQNNSGSPAATAVTVNAGETKQLDNVLQALFGLTDTGGALHVDTPTDTNFVISARTYNQTSQGSFGQYIPAVTSLDAVGAGGRALQILQAEESVRYRTNVGVFEVDGKPATVELTIFLADSKTSAKTNFTLAANEFRQFNVIRDIGLDNVYNARIQVRVLSGDGKVSAYGSVVDMLTQDGTYVPAQ